jgi:hypothetical protein
MSLPARASIKDVFLGLKTKQTLISPQEKKPNLLVKLKNLLNSHPILSLVHLPLAALFFLALALIFTYPAIFNFSSDFISDGGDLFLFAMHQVKTNFATGEYAFAHSFLQRYPVGYNFGIGIDAIFGVVSGALILDLTKHPVFTYNAVIIWQFVVNAFMAYLLGWQLTKKKSLGLVMGVMYGLSFYSLARAAGHLNLMFVAGWPLLALGVLKLQAQKTSWLHVLTLYAGLWLLSWASLQYAIMVVLLILLGGGVSVIFYQSQARQFIINNLRLTWAHLLFGTIFTLAFLWPFLPTVQGIVSGSFQTHGRDQALESYDVDSYSFFMPNPYNHTLFNSILPQDDFPNIESGLFLGVVEILLFIFFFKSQRSKKEKLYLGALVGLFFVVALGVVESGFPMPYLLIAGKFPFSGVAEPGRYVVIFSLFMGIASIMALDSIKSKRLRTIATWLVLLLLILERVPQKYFQAPANYNESIQILASQPGLGVFNIPAHHYRQDYSLTPVYTGKSITDGYIHWSVNTAENRSFIEETAGGHLVRYGCDEDDLIATELSDPAVASAESQLNQEMLDKLRANKIRTIVVYKNGEYYFPYCANVRARLAHLLDQTETAVINPAVNSSLQQTFDGPLTANIYFPQSGIIELHGLHLTGQPSTISATLANQPINLPTSLTKQADSGTLIQMSQPDGKVYEEFKYQVTGGTSLQVSTPDLVEVGAVTIWYSYQPDAGSKKIQKRSLLEKIYSDDRIDIYTLEDKDFQLSTT